MHAQYSTPYMGTNSLTGHKASKETDSATQKESMNPDELKQVIGKISLLFYLFKKNNNTKIAHSTQYSYIIPPGYIQN